MPLNSIYETLLQQSDSYFVVKRSLDGIYTYVNTSFAKRFRYLSDNFIGRHYELFLNDADSNKVRKAIEYCAAKKPKTVTLKIAKRNPESEICWVQWDFMGIPNEKGIICEILCIGHEIIENPSQRLKLIHAIKESKNILNSITDIYMVVDSDWKIITLNKAFEKMVGEDFNTLMYGDLWSFLPRDSKSKYPDFFERAMQEKRTLRFEDTLYDKLYSISIYPSREGITIFLQDISYQKKIKDQSIQLKAISNSTSDANILIDKDYKVLFFNKKAQEEFTIYFKKDLLIGDDFLQYVVNETIDVFKANISKAILGNTVSFKIEIPFQNGTKRWHRFKYFPVYDDDHQIIGVSFNSSDIDDLIRKQEELAESEHRFRHIADAAPILIWMTDEKRNFIYFNKTWLKYTGRTLEQEIGVGWYSNVHTDDCSNLIQFFDSNFSSRKLFEIRFRLKRNDGSYRWILDYGIPRYATDGRFLGYIGSCTDITDLKIAYEQIEDKNLNLQNALEEATKLSQIINNTNNIVILTDIDEKITWVNPSFTNLTGYTTEESLGRNPGELLQGPETDPITRKRLRDAISNKENIAVEILNYCKSGKPYWMEINIQALFNSNDEFIGYMSIQTLITERKENERKIMDQFQTLEEIAFIHSHKIRSPLANILGLVDLINLEKSSLENKIVTGNFLKYISFLDQAAQNLDKLITDIVEMTNNLDSIS